jgi:hypothetical protein
MAERNPAVPVRHQPAGVGNEVVSWPNTAEPTPEPAAVRVSGPLTDPAERSGEGAEKPVAAVKRSLHAAERKSRQTAATIIDGIRTFAHERPLHFLAAVAGIAFVTGAALRIWRSRHHA